MTYDLAGVPISFDIGGEADFRQNPHLRIVQVDGHRVEHVPRGRPIATFRTEDAARRFYGEIAVLNWDFKNHLKVPQLTWLGVRDALARRGVKLREDWTLEAVDAC